MLGNADQLAQVFRSVSDDGPSRGMRTVDVHPAGGITVRLLPDRGLDIGSAWVAGLPIAWRSVVGDTPGPTDGTGGWLSGWGGGLLTTCGLRNVGAPSEGHGMHGTATRLRAEEVTVTRTPLADGHVAVAVHGRLLDAAAFGPSLLLERSITVRSGRPELQVTDRTTNLGPGPEQTPVLYHVNLGSPLVEPATTVTGALAWSRPRDPASAAAGWAGMGPVVAEHRDDVFEHGVTPGEDGWAELRVSGPAAGMSVVVRWDPATLPRVHTWRRATRGTYALAVEPANCSVLGRAADREAGTAPVLEPGEQRTTRVEIRVLTAAGGR
jgi:hypothetical protein